MWKAIILVLVETALGYLLDFWFDPVSANKCKLVLAIIFALYGLYEAVDDIWCKW